MKKENSTSEKGNNLPIFENPPPPPPPLQPTPESIELEELRSENLRLQEENDLLNSEYKILQAEVDELKSRLEVKPDCKPSFEHNGSKYEVVSGAFIPTLGNRTALEISVDTEAQDYLVSKKSGCIRAVE